MALQVEPATPADARAIARIHVDAFYESVGFMADTLPPQRFEPGGRVLHERRCLCAIGGVEIMAVADTPCGDRQGGIRDPRGNLWWVSQRLVDGPG